MPEPFDITLHEQLRQVLNPRSARGLQYPWDLLLMVVSAALAAGKGKLSEISDWVKGHHAEIQRAWERSIERMLGYATLRRVVLGVNILKLEGAIATYSQSLGDSTATDRPPQVSHGWWASHRGQDVAGHRAVQGGGPHPSRELGTA